MNEQSATKNENISIREIHCNNVCKKVTPSVGVFDPSQGSCVPVIILDTPDEIVFAYVVDLLQRSQNGRRSFPNTAPSTFFGDTNIGVSFFHLEPKTGPLVEVYARGAEDWLTHTFVFRGKLDKEHADLFQQLFAEVDFYYLVPGIGGAGNFQYIILPKYQLEMS